MATYALYYEINGTLWGITSSFDPQMLPEGIAFKTLDHAPTENEIWSTESKSFVTMYTKEYIDAAGNTRKLKLDHEPTEQDMYTAQFPYLSKLQMRKLFTLTERVALDNSDALPVADDIKALLRSIKQDFTVADFISLQDPMTIEAITAFASNGLITAERAAQILSGTLPV